MITTGSVLESFVRLTFISSQMDVHGLEAVPAAQVVCLLRLPLGLHRNDPSDRFQLGRPDGLPLLPRRSRRFVDEKPPSPIKSTSNDK